MSRILLVEDDKDIIENLSALLRLEGFQVRSEKGQKEALEAVEEENFDAFCQLVRQLLSQAFPVGRGGPMGRGLISLSKRDPTI